MKKVFLGVLWGLVIWFVLTFLVGGIWGMTHSPAHATTGFLSSNVRNFILLPPSLLLAIVFVSKGQTQLIKKSLISILLALALWFVLAMLAVIAILMSGISHETARTFLHVLNPILLGIMIACSGYFVFTVYPRLKKGSAGRNP
jgi:hypothetical protein